MGKQSNCFWAGQLAQLTPSQMIFDQRMKESQEGVNSFYALQARKTQLKCAVGIFEHT
jgi:hypothetical protein